MASTPPTPPVVPTDAVIPSDPMLGGALAHHPSNRLLPLLTAALIGALIAGVLALTVAQSDAWWALPVTVGGVALAASVLGWYVLHNWNREVVLYQRGFSFREGSQVVYFAYDEVKWVGVRARRLAYFGGLYQRDRYQIDVVTYAGDAITVTPLYQRVPELAARLTEQVDRPLRVEVERAWQRGETITFSETLGLSRDGLTLTNADRSQEKLAWADYSGYKIGRGALAIARRDGTVFTEAPLDALYNHTLLIDLLKQQKPRDAA
ncbi:MAG: DUF6585 family protein [Chloroflexota bacterium]|nr:DUF6585 family protein [Chloroflexota bacterium]